MGKMQKSQKQLLQLLQSILPSFGIKKIVEKKIYDTFYIILC